jgi:C4-type Zn-finger protein
MHSPNDSIRLKDPCPICGASITLAEIEPHPLQCNFEIHGYLCDRCGPVKSLVVKRGEDKRPKTFSPVRYRVQ